MADREWTDAHRLVATAADDIEVHCTDQPFSCFQFVEDRFGGGRDCDALRRCLSLGRSHEMASLTLESIPATGIIADENDELTSLFPDYRMDGLWRLAFWRQPFEKPADLAGAESADLIGYVIMKHDVTAGSSYGGPRDAWHVFEAVVLKYDHEHNCIPRMPTYRVAVGEGQFTLPGILYCQQNGLNKCCAHVALRSLISRQKPDSEISYRQINSIAAPVLSRPHVPGQGLRVQQIRAVLSARGLGFRDVDYAEDPKLRESHPYQKYVYAGIESGTGALLGFQLSGPGLPEPAKHIIPFFGHTFNKDTWVPDADIGYFHIGEGPGYVPSESWTSSFLGHDDNFGPNFAVPRLYADADNVDYVVEIMRPGYSYDGVAAEAAGLMFLYWLYPEIRASNNVWMRRLADWVEPSVQRVVLRAVALSREEYLGQLKGLVDWGHRHETPLWPEVFAPVLPEALWMVEVSIPQLFPANERKLGEIILDATRPLATEDDLDMGLFVMARLPSAYIFANPDESPDSPFAQLPSDVESHVGVCQLL